MKNLLLLGMFVSLTTSLSAQDVLRAIGSAAKQKAEQQDFNATRSNRDKNGLQNKKASKISSESEPASSPPPPPAPEPEVKDTTEELPVQTNPGKYSTSYTFDGKYSYDIEDLKRKKTSKITSYYSDGALWMVTPGETSSSIVDYTNEVMIMLEDKDKTGMVMSTQWANKMAANQVEKEADKNGEMKVEKTGKTKVILGYTCEEWIASDNESKTEMWVTNEAGMNHDRMTASMTKYMKSVPANMKGEQFGMMMEMTSYNSKGVAETHMIMTEFDKTSLTKSLTEYKLQDMTSFGR